MSAATRPEVPRPAIRVPQFPPQHLLLWPGHPKGSAIWRLRRAYRTAWRRRFEARQYYRTAVGCLFWPLIAVVLAAQATRLGGGAVARAGGPSRPLQFLHQVKLALLYRLLPRYYYIFELHRPELRGRAAEFITRLESKGGIYRILKQRENRDRVVRIDDKLTFSRFFGGHGLRVVPVFAAYRDGRPVAGVGDGTLPPGRDLFIKKIEGRGGIGAQSWQALPDGRYRNSAGEESTAQALIDRVIALSRDEAAYLIQPRLATHPAIADLTPGALSTVRLLTILDERGEPEAVNAAFRMALSKTSPVDNFHAGGIASAVDLKTGRLGAATGLGLGGDFSWRDVHPLTGAAIKGRELPDWRAAVELAKAAHRLIAPRVLVGWDIGFLPDGPCLIEGNVGPDADIHQRTELRPIGSGRFGALLAHHLERRLGIDG